MSDTTINIGLIDFEDLKLLEALEHVKSVAARESHAPSFEVAFAVASVANATARWRDSPRWEDVVGLRMD